MRSFSDFLELAAPAMLAVMLIFLFAMPVESLLPLAPNIAWVMGIVVASFAPPAWPRWLAFLLGLLQDVLHGTPLGSQALLSLLLVEMVHANARRQQSAPFRLRWMEASGVLVALHFLLWLIVRASGGAAALPHLLMAGLIGGMWYPLFYACLHPLLARLPGRA